MRKISTLCLFFLSACGGGSPSNTKPSIDNFEFFISGLNIDGLSFDIQNISINSTDTNCSYVISSEDLIHLTNTSGNNFSFKNPITYQSSEIFNFDINTRPESDCRDASQTVSITVNKFPTEYDAYPANRTDLATEYYQVNDIGFGGIVISDRFSATICYPTPDDCEVWENELFGQDAHNMVSGDFNGDGFEDFAVVWALFPHTIKENQKVNAPINIYLNDGTGRYKEDLNLYHSGEAPSHPFAYRAVAKDFNNDGVDDLFAASMGIQVRSEDYSQNYINPYPHLLLLSDQNGKLVDRSSNITDDNNGKGMLCSFAHDASTGDPDGDGDQDIYACNVLLINDGGGNFEIHPTINYQWSINNKYGNPMSSLVVDLNNDKFDDLVFWNFDNRKNWSDAHEGYILLSDNTPNIENWKKIILPTGPFGENHNKYNHAASDDLNNDGFMDVVVSVTRDEPYYEGAYIQILINDGSGTLIDETSSRFSNQLRKNNHHGEGNIYLRDMNNDNFMDIVHSTRDYSSGYHGAHIALNDGYGNFSSLPNSDLPDRPDNGNNGYDMLMKGLPINADNSSCLDLISVTDVGWGDGNEDTRNYLFTLINLKCNK
jgi:hypothetical protein